jgi:hypothetical protein
MKKYFLILFVLVSCAKVVDDNNSSSPISPGLYALAAEYIDYILVDTNYTEVRCIKDIPLLKLKSDNRFERNPWCRIGGCGPTQFMVGGFVTALLSDTTLEGSWFAKPDSLILLSEIISPPVHQTRYALPITRHLPDTFEVLDEHYDTSYYRKFFKIADENASWQMFTCCTLAHVQ